MNGLLPCGQVTYVTPPNGGPTTTPSPMPIVAAAMAGPVRWSSGYICATCVSPAQPLHALPIPCTARACCGTRGEGSTVKQTKQSELNTNDDNQDPIRSVDSEEGKKRARRTAKHGKTRQAKHTRSGLSKPAQRKGRDRRSCAHDEESAHWQWQ